MHYEWWWLAPTIAVLATLALSRPAALSEEREVNVWRWWTLAVLLVMTLGAMACADPRDPGRCIGSTIPDGGYWFPFQVFRTQASEELHQRYPSDISVDLGEDTYLVMELRNAQSYGQTLVARAAPLPIFVVTTPDCLEVWRSPVNNYSARFELDFEPHETKVLGASWSLTDNWGEMVPPGEYYAYGIVDVEEGSTGVRVQLVAASIVDLEETHLRAVRPGNLPVPAQASACEGPASEARVRRVIDEDSEMLSEWQRWSIEVLIADILDENRVSTGRRGIRVVEHVPPWAPPWEDSPFEKLPECLEGVPVQVVVRPDE